MPFQPDFVNGFVQISVALRAALVTYLMAQDSTSFPSLNTVFRDKILIRGLRASKCAPLSMKGVLTG